VKHKIFIHEELSTNMNDKLLTELNNFLGKAMLETYAGYGKEVPAQRFGFKELEFKQGDWEYRDSYTGYTQSWGQEIVWLKGKPFWTQIYGGGMEKEFQNKFIFAHQTFNFLKKALSAGEKKQEFQPRGPKEFKDKEWQYACTWEGDITKFKGNEKISHKEKLVFTHNFIGGLILSK